LALAFWMKSVEVVADHLRHAGGGDRDHLRLVHVVGVGQAVDHVVEAAEHRRVFRHGRGHAGGGLLEVAAEMAAVVGHAALRAVHEGHGAFEADGGEHRAQRLAGLGRVHGQGFAGEVLLAVFPALGPLAHFLHLLGGVREFEVLLLVLEHLHVFRAAEQVEVVDHVLYILSHFITPKNQGRVKGEG
jgi:hypothetical protein